jgi:adenylate kinase
MNEEMKIIIFIGPPGAGKGTQATLLSEKFDLYSFETSKIIEEKIMKAKDDEFIIADGEKFYLKDERNLWKSGSLCSPPFVAYLVMEKIKKLAEEKKGIVFSGSPRTLYEGEKMIPLLKELYKKENIFVIHLKINPETSIWRNSHRRICELFRHSILYNEETKNLTKCPLDGSKLIRREGLDDPETIKVRLKEYEERTLPLLDYFKKEGLKIIEIDGSLSPSDVFENIIKNINGK